MFISTDSKTIYLVLKENWMKRKLFLTSMYISMYKHVLYILLCYSRDEQIRQVQADLQAAPRQERIAELEEEIKDLKMEGKKQNQELRK